MKWTWISVSKKHWFLLCPSGQVSSVLMLLVWVKANCIYTVVNEEQHCERCKWGSSSRECWKSAKRVWSCICTHNLCVSYVKKGLGDHCRSSNKNFSVQGKSLLIKTIFSNESCSHVVSSAAHSASWLQDLASVVILAWAV